MEFEPKQAVTPEPESVVGIRNSRFPERVGRIKPDALEIATTVNEAGQQVIDHVVLRSVINMEGGE